MEGTRTSIWKEVELLSLQNLPVVPYEIPERKLNVKVCPDSHIIFRNNHYSVSYRLRGEFVTVSATATTVKIYFKMSLSHLTLDLQILIGTNIALTKRIYRLNLINLGLINRGLLIGHLIQVLTP